VVRIGEVAAFTLLLALPRRLVPLQGAVEIVSGEKRTTASPLVNTQLLKPLLDLINEKVPQRYYQKLTRWVAYTINVDVCLLMIPPKNGDQLIILAGYSSHNDQYLDGFTVDGHRMPTVLDAIRTGSSVQIDGSASDTELRTLISELGLVKPPSLLLIPFKTSDSSPAMGLVLLSKPSFPVWEADVGSRLTEAMIDLLNNLPQFTDKNNSGALQEELERYQQAYAQLKLQYEALNSQAKNATSKIDNTAALLESQKSLQELVKYLDARNRELENLVSKSRPSIDEVDQLRQELRTALADLARIPTTLSKSDQKMLELQLSAMKQLDDLGQSEMVTSIAQEFRQPLSSIIGYTDLLLTESVGILGATQRKFLERVKASTERLGTLINDLAKMVAIDGGKLDQTLVRVDLEAIIDDAIGEIIAQISEKNITMRVDLPDNLPAIQANKDALQQILANLLQNACLVTPRDGEIRLFARVEKKENEPNYLLVSVTDQGGGIAKVNVARIFSRHYKDDNPSIPGIGDTGVGLSIVKSLIDLQKGRIWVDTKEGSGSTFSCIIPLAEGQPIDSEPGAL
jgi:signal transduction histidine kinase